MRKVRVIRKRKTVFLWRNENPIDITFLIKNNVLEKYWNKMFSIQKENDFGLKISYLVKVAFKVAFESSSEDLLELKKSQKISYT